MDVPVLGVLEFSSIAAGIEAMDFMVKAAPVKIVDAKRTPLNVDENPSVCGERRSV